MSILNTIVKSAHAATLDVGGIKGIGPFGFETNPVSAGETQTQFGSMISTIVTTITVVGGLAFVIFFTLGGLKWLTAGGDKTKVQEAQTQMTQGVIGLVAIVAGLFVVGIVGGVLGIDFLNPFKTLFGVITTQGPTGGPGSGVIGGGGNRY
jgi:cytochrome bd-type quinol oxidase subunit 2